MNFFIQHDHYPIVENDKEGRRKMHPVGQSLESLYSMAGSLAAAQARTYSRTQRLFGLLAVSLGTFYGRPPSSDFSPCWSGFRIRLVWAGL
jgi:hypothetical protein